MVGRFQLDRSVSMKPTAYRRTDPVLVGPTGLDWLTGFLLGFYFLFFFILSDDCFSMSEMREERILRTFRRRRRRRRRSRLDGRIVLRRRTRQRRQKKGRKVEGKETNESESNGRDDFFPSLILSLPSLSSPSTSSSVLSFIRGAWRSRDRGGSVSSYAGGGGIDYGGGGGVVPGLLIDELRRYGSAFSLFFLFFFGSSSSSFFFFFFFFSHSSSAICFITEQQRAPHSSTHNKPLQIRLDLTTSSHTGGGRCSV